MIECDEVIYAYYYYIYIYIYIYMDILWTNVANIILTNATSTMPTNSDDENVRHKMNCYISHTVLLVIILLLIIAIIYYHNVKHWSKQKDINVLTS